MRTDDDLLAAVAAGDQDALRALYDGHAAAMLRLLRRLTSDRGVAEEILQETWLAVWRSADRFRGEASVRGWLLGVARRQAHNRLRRSEPPAIDVAEAPEPADLGADVEARVLAAAGHDEIMAAIRELPPRLREVVVLALVEELPYRDVAEVLGVPVGTVKSRMSGARARLARSLTKGR
ncbi:RNA polymerase sigma factor [Marinitenerispora sediminis]|uniref:RNA polymerase subunit sigma-24 n=1 Tax=Marinitenerispora sediminis TaxID=1931232 RepID=A0A368TCP9_9ACTN|nr:sigma-70 family RNA polymerase sigma factor [Marinitenerispora sediminis]RCV52802.1 RNA polymerase subunit sigma-24 [Marinitenerispora sediminis]RCV59907.1 RNA polymerase subunit sigma-24 [Marinitenerispora sediminis]RCV61323.1 RNA polymerase subunit sigma-24 [Marinitenerispora sediminis]